MNQPATILFLALTFGSATAQDFSYPMINNHGQIAADFIPDGWSILDSAAGDLNHDRSKDAVLVFQFDDSTKITVNNQDFSDTILTQPRILAVLFRDTVSNGFTLKEQSNTFILYHDDANMDDPFDGLAIDSCVLKIKFRIWYNWGSWWTSRDTYKFRFQNKSFVLIGVESDNFHRSSGESQNYYVNFLTKKYRIDFGETVDEEYKIDTVWKTFDLPELKTFKTFSKPYTWDFSEEITL